MKLLLKLKNNEVQRSKERNKNNELKWVLNYFQHQRNTILRTTNKKSV